MAKYNNREVEIVQDFPHPMGDLCKIRYLQDNLGVEVVARNKVILTPAEKVKIDETRKNQILPEYDFQIEKRITNTTNAEDSREISKSATG